MGSKLKELKLLSQGYLQVKNEKTVLQQRVYELEADLNVVDTLELQKADLVSVNTTEVMEKAKLYMAKSEMEKSSLSNENNGLTKSIAKLSAELERELIEKKELERQVFALTDELAQTKGNKYQEIYSEGKGLLEEISTVKSECAKAKSDVEVLTLKLSNAGLELDAKEKRIETLTAENSSQQAKIQELLSTIDLLNDEGAKKDEKIKALNRDLTIVNASKPQRTVKADSDDLLFGGGASSDSEGVW